jgi:hypothetical protein
LKAAITVRQIAEDNQDDPETDDPGASPSWRCVLVVDILRLLRCGAHYPRARAFPRIFIGQEFGSLLVSAGAARVAAAPNRLFSSGLSADQSLLRDQPTERHD